MMEGEISIMMMKHELPYFILVHNVMHTVSADVVYTLLNDQRHGIVHQPLTAQNVAPFLKWKPKLV